MFDYNVTLTKIIWRLDSRKSFAINKLIVRNNTIQKWLSEDKDVTSKVPTRCNVPELREMVGGAPVSAEELKKVPSGPMSTKRAMPPPPAAAAATAAAAPAPAPTPAPAATSSGSLWDNDDAEESFGSPMVRKEEEEPSKPAVNKFATLRSRPKPAESTVVKSSEEPGVHKFATLRSRPKEEPKPAAEEEEKPAAQKFATLRSRPKSAMFEKSSDSSPSGSPSLSHTAAHPVVNVKFNTPGKALAAAEANDPEMTVFLMNKNISYAMKHREYSERLGKALLSNTHITELHLSQVELDNTSAKMIAQGLAKNNYVRHVDISKNKIGNDGSGAFAEALKTNSKINYISLIGQPGGFGESTLEVWLSMLEHNNISLRKVVWRLDSRKSFPINKLIVRNNSIKKFLDDGKSIEEGMKDGLIRIPDTANCSVESLKA
jgi:hypothetical protein